MDIQAKSMTPARATEALRAKARGKLELRWTAHAKEQLEERGLIMGDVIHVLKNGFVYEDGLESTQPSVFKYKMECNTPNSGRRTVRIVAIPSTGNGVKIVTVMWKDED